MYDRISDFYDGKSIFLTGATGFFGSVLLEVLLRCLPGIKHVYVLLRPKKGKDPQERKNIIFQKEIFEKLLNDFPGITDKVKVVYGDISQQDLGINEEDLSKIIQEVSIVIHGAALLKFKLPYKVSIQSNTLGTKGIIELCRKLKKCEVLVYISSAYCNIHINRNPVEEKVYNLPFPLEAVLKDVENKDDEWFNRFLSKHNCKWPNSYTFSKCLTENLLCEEGKDLPVVIFRPSIIFGALKGPRPGYIETGFGSIELPLVFGRGLSSVFIADDVPFHTIPVDIVANALVVSTWLLANNRCSSPLVVNCVADEFWAINFPSLLEHFRKFFSRNLLPNSFRSPSYTLLGSTFFYHMFRLYKDLLPCLVLDTIAHFKGNKLRLIPIQRSVDDLMIALKPFTLTYTTFVTDTVRNMPKQLHPEDREVFYTDLSGTTFGDVMANLSIGSNLFDWKKDKLSPKSRKHIVFENTMITTFIKRFILFMIIGVIYFTVSKMFL